MFLITLCAAYAHPIEGRVVEEYKADQNRKFEQKINHTNVLSMTQDIFIGVFLINHFEKAIEAFDKVVAEIREIIRLARSNPRKQRPNKPYSMNYKRL